MGYNIFKQYSGATNVLPGLTNTMAQAQQQAAVQPKPAEPQPTMPISYGQTVAGKFLQQNMPQPQVAKQNPGLAVANKVLAGGYQNAADWRGQNPNDPAGGFFDYAGRTFTTPEQEQKYAKQSKTRMGIVALADALRHLGNIYHTTKYSPSQQFNSPVQQEYALYKQGKAERDKDNYMIQQQRLQQAKWEAEQAYKAATLGWKAKDYAIKERAADRADAKAKQDQENWQKNFEANQGWRDYQKERQTKMDDHRIENDKANLDIKRQHLAVSWANLQETRAQHAWTRQNSGGGGGTAAAGKQKVFFSGKYGDVSRSQNLTLDEGVSMVKQMRDMGWVTPQKYNEYMSALNNGDANSLDALLNGRVSTGGKGATGGIIQAALQYHPEAATWLNKHYGFVVQEVRKPKAAAPQKPAPAPQKPQKPQTPQKPAAAPQKPAAQKSNTVTAKSTVKGGSNGDNKKKGVYSGFSIHR